MHLRAGFERVKANCLLLAGQFAGLCLHFALWRWCGSLLCVSLDPDSMRIQFARLFVDACSENLALTVSCACSQAGLDYQSGCVFATWARCTAPLDSRERVLQFGECCISRVAFALVRD